MSEKILTRYESVVPWGVLPYCHNISIARRKLVKMNALHDDYPRRVKPIHHFFRRDSDGTDKQGRLVFDYNLCQLRELSLGVIVL